MSLASFFKRLPFAGYADKLSQDIAIKLLKTGPIPRHIAFIMDSDAQTIKGDNLTTGKSNAADLESFSTLLEICYRVGVNTVTVYAFPIKTANKSQSEVDSLFNAVLNKIVAIGEKKDLISQYDVAIKFIGNRKLVPKESLGLIESLEKYTKANKGGVLNIAFPYTSKDDMAQAMRKIATQVEDGKLEPKNIDIVKFEKELYTNNNPDLDILVRASNKTRVSDFMIWESCDNCSVEILSDSKPNLGAWEMFEILYRYSYKATKKFQVEEVRQSKRNDIILGVNAYKRRVPVVEKDTTVLPVVERAAGGKPPKISVTEVARNDAVLAQ